jgi:hypothetical protein
MGLEPAILSGRFETAQAVREQEQAVPEEHQVRSQYRVLKGACSPTSDPHKKRSTENEHQGDTKYDGKSCNSPSQWQPFAQILQHSSDV